MRLNVNGTGIDLSPSPAELTALGERRAVADAVIAQANERRPEAEQRPTFDTDAAYLAWAVQKWAESNPGASMDDLRATAMRALASWARTAFAD